MVGCRRLHDEGAKRGDLTGPNPTDRAKRGVKRSLLTDGNGIPLAATIAGANRNDCKLLVSTLDSILLRGPRGPRRPKHVCLDKGYDHRFVAEAVRARSGTPHIRHRDEPPLIGRVRGRARRWVVERTGSWLNRFRCLLVRWERLAVNHLGLLHLGCALIVHRQAS
jgi:putative transposase